MAIKGRLPADKEKWVREIMGSQTEPAEDDLLGQALRGHWSRSFETGAEEAGFPEKESGIPEQPGDGRRS